MSRLPAEIKLFDNKHTQLLTLCKWVNAAPAGVNLNDRLLESVEERKRELINSYGDNESIQVTSVDNDGEYLYATVLIDDEEGYEEGRVPVVGVAY